MLRSIKERLVPLIIPCFFFAFTVNIFALLELYLSNKSYFFFGGIDILKFSIPGFIALFLGLCVLGLIQSSLFKNKGGIYASIIYALTLALYVQGNFITTSYGEMNGEEIDWNAYRAEGLVSIGVFLCILTIILVMHIWLKEEKTHKIMRYISVCILMVQAVTILILLVMNGGLNKGEEYIASTKDEFNYSKEENIVVLMLDTMDAQAFESVLDDEYEEILKDFTFYPDTAACFSRTDLALPMILTGEAYKNDETYGRYLIHSFEESPLINTLKDNDWKCNIYTTSPFPDSEVSFNVDNCIKSTRTVSSHRRLAEYMYKLAGFRYLIQPLKKYCWFYPNDIKANLEDTGVSGLNSFCDSNDTFFYDMDGSIEMNGSTKGLYFYHLDGAHPPFDTASNFVNTQDEVGESGGIYDETRGMMVLIDKYLIELKKNGIYDKCHIIIMADHGYLGMRQTPLLLIKGIDDNHPFKIDKDTALSHADMQDIFVNMIQGKRTASDITYLDNRTEERYYWYYSWNEEMGYDSYASDITEYLIDGYCWNTENITQTGQVYSHNGINK